MNSIVVNKILITLTSLIALIETTVAKVAYKDRKSAAMSALVTYLKKAAKVDGPVSCTMCIDTQNTLSQSKAIQVLGYDNVATIDFTQILQATGLINEFSNVPDEMMPSFTEAFGLYMGRIYKYGFIDKDTGKKWAFLVQSAKQAQVGKALCCSFEKRNAILEEMGFDPSEFDGANVKKFFKVLMNTFSGQTPFVDNGAAPVKMQDCRVYKSFRHSFHIARNAHYSTDGKRSEMKYDVTDTRPTDAVLIIITEMLPFIWMREHKVEFTIDEQIELVKSGEFYSFFPEARDDIEMWEKAIVQTRGAAMKGLTICTKVIEMGQQMAAEEGKEAVLHLVGQDIKLDIESLAHAGVFCLVSEDVLKWNYSDAQYFMGYKGGNSYLQACGVAHDSDDVHEEVTLSRQMVTGYHGMSEKDVADLYSMTEDLIIESMEDDDVISSMDLQDTAFGLSIVEDRYQAARRNAGFCKVLEKGSFVFACPEIRPIIANMMGFDYRDHQSLRGSGCYYNCRKDMLVALLQRYPTLKMNALFLRIISGKDACYYPEGVIILSLDTLYNAVLKGDYDGDTPLVTLPRSKKEAEYLASAFDFDRIFMPDDDEVTVDEFITIMMEERTVSCATFASVVRAAYKGDAYTSIVTAYAERHNAI